VSDSVADLLEATAPDLLRYFERRHRADAADLLGETMLVTWRRAKDVPSDPVEARMWLFGVARTVLLGHARDTARRSRLADKLRALPEQSPMDTGDAIDVRAAISALPGDQVELVRLVHWEGFSVADAASVMGINASTARGMHQRAKAAIGASLGVVAR
jgi:RNA polymerase sigma-70 factor, ECF subfamily